MVETPVMKILLVEDSAVDRHNIGIYLKEWHLGYTAVESGTKALKILEGSNPPTMALLDWLLPGMDGIELCRRIRARGGNGRYIYTVMLTAKNRKQDLLTAMAAGADDYLAKPVDASELRARIMVGKRILDLQQSLSFAATHDFLTDLLNRSEIVAALQREISRSEREGRSATVIMADVDHFKAINDTMGHAAGDTVLKEVAERLKSDLRPYDLAGRYGGEEFLLILPGCDLRTGIRRADEIRRLVERTAISTGCGNAKVTVSMGVTITPSTRGETLASILQQADSALYAAKNNGRNRVEAFSGAARGASAR
jgi:diguanylate cyclase (GGDEF)-like protein